MSLGQYLSLPASANGLSPISSASAWAYGSYVEASASLASDIYVIGIAFQVTNTPSLDVTHESLFEIATGAGGAEVTKIQIPYSHRPDTLVGYYLDSSLQVFLPEDFLIAAGTRVVVRATDSLASAITYGGVKIMYREGATPVATRSYLMLMGVS